jgi:hypothetical protein
MGGTGAPAQQQPGSWWEQMVATAAILSPGQYMQRLFWGLPREERPGVRKNLESILQVGVKAVQFGRWGNGRSGISGCSQRVPVVQSMLTSIPVPSLAHVVLFASHMQAEADAAEKQVRNLAGSRRKMQMQWV